MPYALNTCNLFFSANCKQRKPFEEEYGRRKNFDIESPAALSTLSTSQSFVLLFSQPIFCVVLQ